MAGIRPRTFVGILGSCALTALVLPGAGAVDAGPASPGPYNTHGLNAVDLVSANEGWAVGGWYGTDSGARSRTIAKHWDGVRWRTVPTVDPGGHANTFYGVSALSSDDAWAVGLFEAGLEEPNQPLIEHWDGTAWTQFPAPEADGFFYDVVALGRNNVWAVGAGAPGRPFNSLIAHWDGTSWSDIPHPQPDSNGLVAISALSPHDIWAVGSSDVGLRFRPLVEHWNGRRWTVVLDEGELGSRLSDVTAISTDDVWAVGDFSPDLREHSEVLVYHWDGTQWSKVAAPGGAGDRDRLIGVTAVAADDVWAVGTKGSLEASTAKTLIVHWDGARWRGVKSPNRARAAIQGQSNELDDVAAVSADDLWAVGSFSHVHQSGHNGKTKEIIDHWDGHEWTNFLVNKEPR